MKKIALVSDIHGNYRALEAFLDFLADSPVDGIICLGDYVTDSPYPERTMALLREMRQHYPCYMLRGNREDYLLNNRDNHENWKRSSANGVLYYTLQRLTGDDLDFFNSLPTERELQIEGCPILYICHGTPGRVRGNVDSEPGLREQALHGLSCSYLLGGHSHHQEQFEYEGKFYINPGSLGIAFDGVGKKAQFVLLTGTALKWQAEFFSIPYDVEGFLKDFSESGVDEMGMTLSKAVKKNILTGRNYFYECILAMEQEAKKAGVPSIADMPEETWREMEDRFDL